MIVSLYAHAALNAGGISAMTDPATTAATISMLKTLLPLIAIIFLVGFFIGPLILGIYISIADQGYQKRRVSLNPAFKVAKANYFRLLITEILVCLTWLVVGIVLGFVFTLPLILFGHSALAVVWLLIGLLVALIVFIFLGIYLYQAYVVVMLEGKAPVASIKRSIQIGKQNTGNIFIVFVVLFVILMIFSLAVSVIIVAIELPLGLLGAPYVGLAIAEPINFVLSSFVSVWTVFVSVAFYKEFVSRGRRTKK